MDVRHCDARRPQRTVAQANVSITTRRASLKITTAIASGVLLALAALPRHAIAAEILPGDIIFSTADAVNTLGDIQAAGTVTISTASASRYSGSFSGTGSLIKLGDATLTIAGANSFSGGTTISDGAILLDRTAILGNASSAITINTGGLLDLGGTTQTQTVYLAGGTIQNGAVLGPIFASGGNIVTINAASTLTATSGITTLSGTNNFSGGIFLNGGELGASFDSNLGTGNITFNGGMLRILGTSFNSTTGTFIWGPKGGGFDIVEFTAFNLNQQLTGTGGLTLNGIGTLNVTSQNSYSGGTTINGGVLLLENGATLGSSNGTTTVNAGGLLIGGTVTQAAVILNGGEIASSNINAPIISTGGYLDWVGGRASVTTMAGLTKVWGMNSYTGATIVNGGVLDVEGTLTGTSSVTVNAGGTLTGVGVIDPLVVSIARGGTFAAGTAPGNSTTIIGNLAMASGALYVVQLNTTASSFANVNGNATLGGASVGVLASDGFLARRYTILTATSGITGSFNSLVTTNLSSNVKAALSYDVNNVYLNLSLAFTAPPSGPGLSGNQQGVGNAIAGFFNAGNGISLIYGGLTPSGLTQASGESSVGTQQTTFNAMNQFMGVISDGAMAGRDDLVGTAGPASGYADEAMSYAASARASRVQDAYAMFTKAKTPQNSAQRWNVWVAGFGGSQTTNGNAAIGSNDVASSIYGTAIGADYRISPDTLVGFALAGGGTNFNTNGLGSGRSDLFQAGAYLRHRFGPAYLSAALAYGWQDVTTDRTVTIAGVDRLHAEFNANTWSGRLEGGYRFAAPWSGVGLTPYAAAEVTTFDLPAYAESVASGAGTFALAYAAKAVTDTRSELGLRADRSFAAQNGALILRGRAAWAHDYEPNRSVAATFQALPGASYVVNGAAQASDAAIATVSAEMKWTNGWSAAGTVEGEFSDVTRSYVGKGVLRYTW